MKTEPTFHNGLREEIRKCFPAVMRERIEIRPLTLWHESAPPKTIVRISFDELPHYDREALMNLLGADQISGDQHTIRVRGRYSGLECEVELVAEPARVQ